MKQEYYSLNKDGFYGVYYENPAKSSKAFIAMIGDSSDDRLAKCAVKWLHKCGCNVLCMSPDKKDYGHHNIPLERFGCAIELLKEKGNTRLGVLGASTTGMMALLAASYYGDITLTMALSPSDFVMEGFYQDKLDGAGERPGDNESTVTWQGKPLPYLPFAYRHPEYWYKLKEEAKTTKNMVASRNMFDESERRHPLCEEEKIKVENICGRLVLVGAEDDALWDTCKYIRRMEQRLESHGKGPNTETLIYEHGTHFVFPESILKSMFPIGADLFAKLMFAAAKQYPRECKETRLDIDRRLTEIIAAF